MKDDCESGGGKGSGKLKQEIKTEPMDDSTSDGSVAIKGT